MKVILSRDVENLGARGDVVDVKKGYARNYLLPRGVAFFATSENLKRIEQEKLKEEQKRAKALKDAQLLADKMKKTSCTISAQTGTEGALYGSVTNEDIAEALRMEDINIDKKMIIMEEPIRKLGVYEISVRLHPEVNAEIKVWVIKE